MADKDKLLMKEGTYKNRDGGGGLQECWRRGGGGAR